MKYRHEVTFATSWAVSLRKKGWEGFKKNWCNDVIEENYAGNRQARCFSHVCFTICVAIRTKTW
jgi:hypothetical protein